MGGSRPPMRVIMQPLENIMSFSSKTISGSFAAISMGIFLCLGGCGTKTAEGPSLGIETPAPSRTSAAGATLSKAEREALHSTGQIDKNLSEAAMKDVEAEYKYFLRSGRNMIAQSSKRAQQYLAHARKVFRDKGMPEDLAYLAIVESGYRADARSRAGALGAWQFMPFTGKKYGLSQDWWQDERLDPYKATEAAADYLGKLYNDFGDWPTAIAAYNAGEGKMSRAMAGTGGKNFFEVKELNESLSESLRLREETKQYVPRFIAISKIMRNLGELGFEPIDTDKSVPVLRYTAKPGTDLKEFARVCNLNWDEFTAYNNHHKRNITCTDKETFVYVPEKAKKSAAAYLCSAKTASFAGWAPVTVASRVDSLEKISARSKVPLAMLQAANPGLGRLKVGQVILAPGKVNMAIKDMPEKAVAKAAQPTANATMDAASHLIRNNDTFFSIAKKYNVTVNELMAFNGIKDPSALRAGRNLRIPGKKGARTESRPETPARGKSSGSIGRKTAATYTVQSKDNLWSIARKHKISVADLKRLNKIDEKCLMPGTCLIVADE